MLFQIKELFFKEMNKQHIEAILNGINLSEDVIYYLLMLPKAVMHMVKSLEGSVKTFARLKSDSISKVRDLRNLR